MLDSLRSLSYQLGLSENIKFLGFQSNMNKYYNISDVVILPSHSEAFPNVILEAMAVGKPIIATFVGGIPEIISHRENGYLVEPKNPQELARGIKEIINNKKLRIKISENALKDARQYFSIELMMNKIYQIYLELLH